MNIHHGMNRLDLDKEVLRLGGTVDILRRTGDVRYTHPLMAKPSCRANSRRKDAPRKLTQWVLEVIRRREAANDDRF